MKFSSYFEKKVDEFDEMLEEEARHSSSFKLPRRRRKKSAELRKKADRAIKELQAVLGVVDAAKEIRKLMKR